MNFVDHRNYLRSGPAAARPEYSGLPAPPAAGVRSGGVRMIEVDGRHLVWTKRVGFSSTRVLTLHGGPGLTHEYLECFEDFLPPSGIEFYYYDQLGSAYSEQPDDASLWTLERYREEVEQVRSALGLKHFHLYGHGWGGVLALEYALKYPQHLKGLIVSGTGSGPEPRQLCRLNPWPEPLTRALRNRNTLVHEALRERLRVWDRTSELGNIQVPTLLLGGRHDEVDSSALMKLAALLPRSRAHLLEHGGYMCMYDDQQAYFRCLLAFIRDVQARRFL